jgi:hypothetical protein
VLLDLPVEPQQYVGRAPSPVPAAPAPAPPPYSPPPPVYIPDWERRIARLRERCAAITDDPTPRPARFTRPHTSRWPRCRDPQRLINILLRHRPIEPCDEKIAIEAPELTAGLHSADLPAAPAELAASPVLAPILDNNFNPDSVFIDETDSTPVCEIEAEPVHE